MPVRVRRGSRRDVTTPFSSWPKTAGSYDADRLQPGSMCKASTLAVVLAVSLSYALAASTKPQNVWHLVPGRSRGLQQEPEAGQAFDCAGTLAKKTIVIFPGPEPPWLGDLETLMPTHKIDVSEASVGYLPLSVPEAASCAQSMTAVPDTLMVWEDGNLTQYQSSLPRNIENPKGQIIVKGKPGRDAVGLTRLDFLKNLQSAGGLSVYNMDGLKDMRGLDKLTTVSGDLIISENDNLKNLTGLDNLQSIGADLLIASNMNLKTLDGLGDLNTIGGQFLLKGNGYIMNTDALTSLRRVRTSVTLTNNGNLQMTLPPGVAVGPDAKVVQRAPEQPGGNADSLLIIYSGEQPPSVDDIISATDPYMPPLQKFDISVQRARFHPASQAVETGPGGVLRGNVVVYDDGTLDSLKPSLGAVTSIGGSLIIVGGIALTGLKTDSPGLQSLDGLQGITAVGSLGIICTTQLHDFTGLDSLETIGKNLAVMFNVKLKSFAGLGSSVGVRDIDFQSLRGRGLRQVAADGTAAANKWMIGGLRKIGSEMWLQGNTRLQSLSGLESLESVSWRINIRDNKQLKDLDALGSLARIGDGLTVSDCYGLESIAGLTSLEVVGRSIALLWNTQLKDLGGLSRINILPGDFTLAGSPAITTLESLGNLTEVGMNMVIDNTAVTTLAGLEKLTIVGGALSISDNPRLITLEGLRSLSQVGDDLGIRVNPKLTTLSPLDQVLQTVGGGVYIEDNPSLSSLGDMPQRLAGAGGNVVVRRNGGIDAAQIAALKAKGGQGSGVPSTNELLPAIQAKSKASVQMPLPQTKEEAENSTFTAIPATLLQQGWQANGFSGV